MQVLAFGYVADFSQLFQVRSDLHQMVRDAFVIHGIVVPYPRQDVRVFAGGTASPALNATWFLSRCQFWSLRL